MHIPGVAEIPRRVQSFLLFYFCRDNTFLAHHPIRPLSRLYTIINNEHSHCLNGVAINLIRAMADAR